MTERRKRIDVFLGVDATNGTPAILSGRTDESRGSLNARTTSDTENSSQSTANVSTATDESSCTYIYIFVDSPLLILVTDDCFS